MRLIDAEALAENWFYTSDTGTKAVELIEIEEAPTIDAAPVVHGQWQDIHEGKTIRCTHCFSWVKSDCIEGKDPAFSLPNYCPNCGAKMDRKDDAQ